MDAGYLRDLFAVFGPIEIRRLFGGFGIYWDGRIIGCVIRGELRIKVDEETIPEFRAAGSQPWVYTHKAGGKPVTMPYWTLPDAAMDDPEAVAHWARLGREAALRSAAAKPAPKTKRAAAKTAKAPKANSTVISPGSRPAAKKRRSRSAPAP